MMIMFCRRFFLLIVLFGVLLSAASDVWAQSDFERIVGSILSEIERQSRDDRQNEPGQDSGIWRRQWSNFPNEQTGTFKIHNKGDAPIAMGFTRPNNGGTYRRELSGHRKYTRSKLPIGTSILVIAGGNTQQFELGGALLSVTVEPNGEMTMASTSIPPINQPDIPSENGSLFIKNNSNRIVELTVSAPPPFMGAWADSVRPQQEWFRPDLAVGTTVTISGDRQRTVDVKRVMQQVFVEWNGAIKVIERPGQPFDPIPPPSSVGTVVLANLSGSDMTASISLPRGGGASFQELKNQTETPLTEIPQGTQITLRGPKTNRTFTTTGEPFVRYEVQRDGRIRINNAPQPIGPPDASFVSRIEVVNRSGNPITASYGSRTREIPHRSGHLFLARPPSRVLTITGNGATASFVPDQRSHVIRVYKEGRFENLPPNASVVPDAPEPTKYGQVLLVNRSSQQAMFTYLVPGLEAHTVEVKSSAQPSWTPAPVGSVLNMVCGTSTGQVVVAEGQWTSFVVDPQGRVIVKTTMARHEPESGPDPAVPIGPDSPSDVDPWVNPDPPSNDDPAPKDPDSNPLPKPDATPLVDWVVRTFSRNTSSESKALVELLDATSKLRVEKIGAALDRSGVDGAELVDAAKGGDALEVASLVAGVPEEKALSVQEELDDLAAIATMRKHLVPLKSKLTAGASAGELTSHVAAIEQQAENLGNEGLAEAMKRVRRDFSILGTLTSALESTGLAPTQLSLPQGEVNVIHHPWIKPGNSYFASSGLVLKDSSDGLIHVSKMDSTDVFALPVAKDAEAMPDFEKATYPPVVLIENPADNKANLRYRIDGRNVTLLAGERQSFAGDAEYLIEFARGSSGERARYSVNKPGIYAFTSDKEGWKLVARKIGMKVANPQHSTTLTYLVDGEPEVLEPGGTAVHTSTQPMLLVFDQGEGMGAKRKLVYQTSMFHFAIDPETGYWDLYQGEAPTPAEPKGEVLQLKRPSLAEIQQAAGESLFDFSLSKPSSGSLIEDLR